MRQFRGNVSCNYIYDYSRSGDTCIASHKSRLEDDNSYPFGFFWLIIKKDKSEWGRDFWVGELNGIHEDIQNELIDSWSEKNGLFPEKGKNLTSIGYSYRGRVWLDAKAFAFDQSLTGVPDKAMLVIILRNLQEALGEDFDGFKIYISDCVDRNTPTDDYKMVNEYSIREYLTGLADGEKEVDIAQRRAFSDFFKNKYAGEKAYNDFQANDPRADRMYKDFVSEHKNRTHMKTLILNERQCRLLRIDECIDNILNEATASPRKGEYVYKGNGTPGAAAMESAKAGYAAFCMLNRDDNAAHFVITKASFPAAYEVLASKVPASTQATTATPAKTTQNTTPQQSPNLTNNIKEWEVNGLGYSIVPSEVILAYIKKYKKEFGTNISKMTAAKYAGIDRGLDKVGISDKLCWNIISKDKNTKVQTEDHAPDGTSSRTIISKGIDITKRLIALGLNGSFAIAIAGNFCVESECSPYCAPTNYKDAKPEGLAQWISQPPFMAWVAKHFPKCKIKRIADKSIDEDTLTDIQLRYLIYDIDVDAISKKHTPYWKKGRTARGSDKLSDLTLAFMTKYERPGDESGPRRISYAQYIYDELTPIK